MTHKQSRGKQNIKRSYIISDICLILSHLITLQELAVQSIADFRKYVKILEEDSKGSHRPGFILNLKVPKQTKMVDKIFGLTIEHS